MQNSPKLNGLILAGGKSSRMGKDKALMSYESSGQLLIEKTYSLLSKYCNDTYISLSKESTLQLPSNYQIINDLEEPIGPLGGLISAFENNPDSAWFVIACDMPQFDENTFKKLLAHRNMECDITAFHNPKRNEVEPLCAIYEPSTKIALLKFYKSGQKSLTRFIKSINTNLIKITETNTLTNVNTREEFLAVTASK